MNYARHLRKIRQKIFDYPPEKQEKADRVLREIKLRAIKQELPRNIETWFDRVYLHLG